MNLKIDRVLPYPPSVVEPYIFTYLPSLDALLVYFSPPPQQKQEQPNKKKFTFKANSNPAPTAEEVFIFQFNRSAWRTQQTKGKFPTKREQPAVTSMGPCMMVYGGKQVNPAKHVNDLYCLNLTSWQWKKLFAMQAPPASPNPQAFPLSDESLLILGKQIWIFSAKGVNWQLQKGDLPGGIWEKIQISEIPFEIKCGVKVGNQIIIFGWDGGLKAASIDHDKKIIDSLPIQGEIKGKGQRLQMVNTSQGNGLVIDGVYFGSFTYRQKTILLNEWIVSQQVCFDKISSVLKEGKNINYGISTKKQLVFVEIEIEKEEQPEEEQMPNTSRQIEADYMKSSLIQKQYPEQSPVSRSSLKEDGSSASLVKFLGPLLSAECRKRNILDLKSKLLQDSIKKAQKMVLALCRYGGEQQKRIHINKVRKIRQNLSQIFTRQTYFRKQMQNSQQNNLKDYVLRQFGVGSNHSLDDDF